MHYLTHIDRQKMLYYDVPFIASHHIQGHRIFNLHLMPELSKLFSNKLHQWKIP